LLVQSALLWPLVSGLADALERTLDTFVGTVCLVVADLGAESIERTLNTLVGTVRLVVADLAADALERTLDTFVGTVCLVVADLGVVEALASASSSKKVQLPILHLIEHLKLPDICKAGPIAIKRTHAKSEYKLRGHKARAHRPIRPTSERHNTSLNQENKQCHDYMEWLEKRLEGTTGSIHTLGR